MTSATRPLLLTTPIYYVNDKPHIGHAYTTLLADVLANFYRSLGREVFFLTGTDEHGTKVADAAKKRGVSPQAHCDEMVERFRALWKRLGVVPDHFIRTTDASHREFVRAQLSRLHDGGEIEARDFTGWYCVGCERYWTEKDLVEERCPECRREVARLTERNYFFKMSQFRDAIREEISSERLAILPATRRNEVLGFLDKELGDLCISRPKSRLAWGVEIPFDADFVTYVWFDALLNYISGAFFSRRRADAWQMGGGSSEWEIVHLIGKDILTTHAVYWPAMLLGLGVRRPDRIVAHGWWKMTGEKMSKSIGNVVDPNIILDDFGDSIGGDLLRYFLLREVPLGDDGSFSMEAMEERYRADLGNDLGNLVGRLSAPKFLPLAREIPLRVPAGLAETVRAAREAMEAYRPHEAIDRVFAHLRETNRFLQEKKPWAGGAGAGEAVRLASTSLLAAAGLLAPVLPHGAQEIARRFGLSRAPRWSEVEAFARGEGGGPFSEAAVVPTTGDPIYPRREPASTPEVQAPKETAAHISYDDFAKIDLRVAKITSAQKIEGKDRLLRLEIDLGTEQRTLVAGIALAYAPDALLGKRIVVVANLKPAKIGGVLSQGMLLAASDETGLTVVSPDREIAPGAKVK